MNNIIHEEWPHQHYIIYILLEWVKFNPTMAMYIYIYIAIQQ